MYSIVDVETTGGYKQGNKITEIAIVTFDGEKIVEKFSSLINPERNIPFTITRLTGITNEMVIDAPKFYEVAKRIIELTENTTFVAHNVFFDYRFIQREFSELGYTFKLPKICTVRMSRKAFPGLKSYSLGRLCRDLNIEIKNRHRAMGDCEATVKLFSMILKKNDGEVMESIETEKNRIPLPSQLNLSDIESLPEKPGVYYFYNLIDQLLYVGKSKNIRKRVFSHFRVDVKNRRDLELKSQVSRIEYKETGNELAALLLESHEIKKLRPRFNRQLRYKRYNKGLRLGENKEGVAEIQQFTKDQFEDGLYFFSNRRKAESMRNALYRNAYGVSADSFEFEKKKEMLLKTLGKEEHNKLLTKIFHSKTTPLENYNLEMQGRKRTEICLVTVKDRAASKIIFQKKKKDEREVIRLTKNEDSKIILYNYLRRKSDYVLKEVKDDFDDISDQSFDPHPQ